MKKIILFFAVILAALPANAQMIETIGALGVQGELGVGAYQGLTQMQGALGRINFQQDLTELLFAVQTNMMGNYRGLSKSTIPFSGFNNIDWNIESETPNSFYLEFNHLDAATCMSCKSRDWNYRSIDINNGGDCGRDNHVKMTF